MVLTDVKNSQAKALKNDKDEFSGFGELLKRAGGFGDLRDCPSSCGTVIQIRKSLMNRPEIVSIGLVWDSERPTIDHIMDVFHIIGMTLKLQDVFHSVVDSRWAASATHQLVGIVTYYGKHYSTFFFHTKLRVWIYFDDAAVREIGPKWEQVVEKCCRGHFQPLLLLYADPHGTSVSTSTAPHRITIVSGDKKNLNGKDMFDGVLKYADKLQQIRHRLPIDNQRRAMTPNPETLLDSNANIQPRRAVTPNAKISHALDAVKTDISDKYEHNFESLKQPHLIVSSGSNSKTNSLYNSSFNMLNSLTSKHEFWQLKHTENDVESVGKGLQFNDKLHNELSYNIIAQNVPMSNNCLLNSNAGKNNTDISNIICIQSSSAVNMPQPFTLLNSSASNYSNIPFQGLSNNSLNIKSSGYKDDQYISRRTVESVLQLQKLQKQKPVNTKHDHVCFGQRNSNSSLDSLDNICLLQDRNINSFFGPKFDIPEAINISRRRDSGNWSGDRNSASSSSTTSLDNPYFYAVGNKRPLSSSRVINKPSVSDSIASTDPGYDSFSLSSSDSYPSMIAFPSGKTDLRLGQILENQQSTFIPSDLSQFQNLSQESIKSHDTHFYGFRDECEKLCIEADTFLAKSVERENIGDISMAALLSDSAAAKARAAMDVPYCNPKSLSLAKLKHSMCIVRSCNLHKKLKEAVAITEQQNPETTSKLHKNNVASYDLKSGDFFPIDKLFFTDKPTNLPDKGHATCHTCIETACENSGKTIEIYATLPKKSLKKKGTLMAFMESLTNEDSCVEKTSKHKHTEPTVDKKLGHTLPHQNIRAHSSPHILWKCSNSESSSSQSLDKKKSCNFAKSQNKDSDISHSSSEWEGTQKCVLRRTYSGPPLQRKIPSQESTDENQTYSGHPMKKQHKIRRKLMGGFMKRKNRSLPDLREGQDQLNGLSHSFADNTIYQTSLPLRKVNGECIKNVKHAADISIMFQENKRLSSGNMQNKSMLSLDISEVSKTPIKYTTRVSTSRTHTPPPYKPPPPIMGAEFDMSFKSATAHKKEFSKSHDLVSIALCPSIDYPHASPDDITNKCLHCTLSGKITAQNRLTFPESLSTNTEPNSNCCRNDQKMPKGNIVWLKELQKKQEEIFQKKKLQEELLKKHKHLKENSSVLCLGTSNYQRKCESKREDLFQLSLSQKCDQNHDIFHNTEDNRDTFNNENVNSPSENGQPNSVKYLTSKFEKILKPACGTVDSNDDIITTSLMDKNYGIPVSENAQATKHVSMEFNDKLQLHESMSDRDLNFFKEQENINKDQVSHLFTSASFSVHNTHLTDRQFTKMLRTGATASPFKSTNLSGLTSKDTGCFLKHNHNEIMSQTETRRPDKPPDYETAIQRLELIRSDKNLIRQLETNHLLNTESNILEDKRKRGSKKSVTFSDKVVLVACAGDEDSDFIPNPLLERVYKQHLLQSTSADISTKIVTDNIQRISDSSKNILQNDTSQVSKSLPSDTTHQPCNLCHNKTVSSPNIYCPDCAFYMSRFQT